MDLILLGLGGAMGSVARYKLGHMLSQRTKAAFPVGTFIINLTGAILLGIVCGIDIKGNMYLFLADGFLGAYTTFSTFMYEGFHLFSQNKKANAFCYIIFTLVLGIIGFVLGLGLGNLINMIYTLFI